MAAEFSDCLYVFVRASENGQAGGVVERYRGAREVGVSVGDLLLRA